jgi:N-acetylglucosaminyl-diphospho-decaprenol L-rhamnosyltransferase
MPELSIIIPSWNTRELLAACLASVAATTGAGACEVIVVDNGSTDGSRDMVRQCFSGTRLVTNADNLGFARAVNQGAAAAGGRYLLLLNSDARLLPGAVDALLEVASGRPRCGAVGAQLRHADGSFQASHNEFPSLMSELLVLSGVGRLWHGPWYPSHGPEEERGSQRVEWVGGACLLVRRSAFAELGGLDEGFFFYGEEMDLCYRLRHAGWEVWYQPAARVIHVGGASSRRRRIASEGMLYAGRIRFFRKHYGERAARALALEIYAATAVKRPLNALVRWLSRGRYGRPVIPLRSLAGEIRRAYRC